MPSATPNGPGRTRAATLRHRGAPALPLSTTTAKRARPPTADSATLASSPMHRPSSDVIVTSEGPQRSPTKRSRTARETATAVPSTPPGRSAAPTTPSTPTRTTTTRTIPLAAGPLTTAVPRDVARICGIPAGHADTITTALSIVHEADGRLGAEFDAILQRLYYTITSQALHAAAAPAPTTVPTTAANPPATYASTLAAQTTPLPQQTNQRHGNTSPTTATQPATKPPPREEVILRTSRMTSPPPYETIINVIKSAAGDRVQAVA
ncbi:hypothetical protein SBRCBS47491_010261, partial [Sporothrix bragantina]